MCIRDSIQIVGMIELNPGISTSQIIEHFRNKPEWKPLNRLAQDGLSDTSDAELESPLGIFEHAIRQINQESKKLKLKKDYTTLAKPPSQMSVSEKDELRRRLDALSKK